MRRDESVGDGNKNSPKPLNSEAKSSYSNWTIYKIHIKKTPYLLPRGRQLKRLKEQAKMSSADHDISVSRRPE